MLAVVVTKGKSSEDMIAFSAKADLSADSRAVTGLVQPCSSVDIRAVAPAPVRASGPVQITC